MAHIPEQLLKINKNIQEAEVILSDLKKRTKTENVAEQIEHFESMLNKLNSLRESYIQLSAQYKATNDTHDSFSDNQKIASRDNMIVMAPINLGSANSIRSSFSPVEQLELLKQERDRLKREVQDRQLNNNDQPLNSLEVDVTNSFREFSPSNSFNDLVSDLHNFTGLDLSFYISVLDHHIEIGSKMVDMVNGLNLSDNLSQGICLLKEVIQRLNELRERFQCVQNTKETVENQSGIDEDILQREMDTFNSISEDLKSNFTTGVKCFKSAMDIIQSYLDPDFVQIDDSRVDNNEECCGFSNKLGESVCNGSILVDGDKTLTTHSKNNNNNSESASEDNNNRSNEDDNNDGGDEDSDDSCREKDQDEAMEVGDGSRPVETMSEDVNKKAMHNLKLQTEFEQKEILRLMEEKRIMLKKLEDLKRAKEMAKNQVLGLAESGNMFGDLSQFLSSSQYNDLDDEDNEDEVCSNSPRPDSLSLRTGKISNDIGSLLKMFSDIKTEVECDESHPNCSSKISTNIPKLTNDLASSSLRLPPNSNPFSSFSTQSDILLPQLNSKAEELKQKQFQIQKLQEMLDQIKNESIIRDSIDDYDSDHNNDREITNNGRPTKGRDSVTFQEPVATFIANEELYENMREVRMRREELRERSVRNSNSDPRSPSGLVMDSGNAPGAPPDAPTRMAVSSHETASQDRTTVATWGSSSAGGDDYEENSGHNQLNSENLRIRTEPTTRVTPMTSANDERSRVAPIGQSSTFRSKARQQQQIQSHQNVSLGPVSDLNNLKGQIENIASLCRNMAMEQNRLARDIADLKNGSSPRQTSGNSGGVSGNGGGPDLVMHHSPWTALPSVSKQPCHMATIDDSHYTPTNVAVPTRNGADCVGPRPSNNQMETSWDEASLASSTVHQQQRQVAATATNPWYCGTSVNVGYQQFMHQQNMLLQNHNMFIKLQMSLMASQLEQQRLCSLALQQQQQQQHNSIYPPVGSYYPPLGPLVQPHLSMLPSSVPDPSTMMGFQAPVNFMDLDCGLYSMYPPDNRGDTPSTINHHNNVSHSGANWKNGFIPTRNGHRN